MRSYSIHVKPLPPRSIRAMPSVGRPRPLVPLSRATSGKRDKSETFITSGQERVPSKKLSILQEIARKTAALSAAALVSLMPTAALARAVVRFPASSNPEVFAVQKTLVEAWSIVGQTYVDPEFNGQIWESELAQYMGDTIKSVSAEQAYSHIERMLADLQDPYTRILPASEYANFRVSADGELQGVGMLVASSKADGRFIVLAPIKGGPADRAGILPGDELVDINGEGLQGLDGEGIAQRLRGPGGTSVLVRLARRTDQIPGVPGHPEPPPEVQYHTVQLRRERVMLSPVASTSLSNGSQPYGYVRLSNFSQNAADDVAEAVLSLEKAGVKGFVLDLRHNGGGLVRSGIDTAALFLEGPRTVFHVSARPRDGEGAALQQVVALRDHAALTQAPLVVLVDSDSASASEILAGALHDNHRAQVIGDRTYGKGKIQSVFELGDGSALFVTVAKYLTPSMQDIDQVGIVPDTSCGVPAPEPAMSELGDMNDDEEFFFLTPEQRLMMDPCIIQAQRTLDAQM